MALKVPTDRSRRVCLATLAALLVVLLSGCLRYTESLTIESDDTVSGIVVIATQPAQDEGTGAVPTPPANSTLPIPQSQSDSIVVSSYANGNETGYQVTFNRASFEDVSAFAPLGDRGGALKVSRDGNVVTVTMSIDLTWAASTSDLEYFKNHATATVELTVPGEIGATDGDVNGQTITWQLTPLELNTLSATFDSPQAAPTSTSSESVSMLRAVIIAAVLLVLAAAIWYFLLRPMLTARRAALAEGPAAKSSVAAPAPERSTPRSDPQQAGLGALLGSDPEPTLDTGDESPPRTATPPVTGAVPSTGATRESDPFGDVHDPDPFGDAQLSAPRTTGPGTESTPVPFQTGSTALPSSQPLAVPADGPIADSPTAIGPVTGGVPIAPLADPFGADADDSAAPAEAAGDAVDTADIADGGVPNPPAPDDPFEPSGAWAPDPGPEPATPPPFTLSPPHATTPANETPPVSGVFQIPDPFGDQSPAENPAPEPPMGGAPAVSVSGAHRSNIPDPFVADDVPEPIPSVPAEPDPVVGDGAIALPGGYPDASPADLTFTTAAADFPAPPEQSTEQQLIGSTSIAGGGWPPPRPRWKDS